jgi:hypothetical protein
MDAFNLKRLTLPTSQKRPTKPVWQQKPPHHKPGEKFLKGPVPLSWLLRVAQLPGKSLHVGVAIWFLAGLKNTRDISLPNALLKRFGINRNAKYRSLAWLERNQLIAVERHSGRNPVITILDVEGGMGHNN